MSADRMSEAEATLEIRYRSVLDAPPPRRIRLEIPGWSGPSTAHGDGAPAQPWHCQPFVEGATYGLELVYPYKAECRVSRVSGAIQFDGEIEAEAKRLNVPHPFGAFARGHYGMATALDLLPPEGYALRLGPHPRFYTGTAGDVPLAIAGHLQRFWPSKFFAVFRAPPEGEVHVFRPGEGYAQLLLVPATQTYTVEPMPDELVADRSTQERQLMLSRYFLAKHVWQSDTGNWFDDAYKQLLRLFRQRGGEAVREQLAQVAAKTLPEDREGRK